MYRNDASISTTTHPKGISQKYACNAADQSILFVTVDFFLLIIGKTATFSITIMVLNFWMYIITQLCDVTKDPKNDVVL